MGWGLVWEKINLLKDIFVSSSSIVLNLILMVS